MWDGAREQFVAVKPQDVKRKKALGKKVFTIGQEVTIDGLRCRVRKITRKDLVLRPLKGEQ